MNTSGAKPTTFVFDCFGVILKPVLGGWYKDHSARHGFKDDKILDTFRQFDLGKLTEDDMLDYFLKYPGVASTKEALRKEIDAYLELDADMAKTIRELKQSGFKTALLSNGNDSFFQRKIYTTYPEFKDLFQHIFVSSSLGMVKPDHEIYTHALEAIGSKPDESVFVDDNAANVAAAIEVGMRGFVYTTFAPFKEFIQGLGVVV